MIITNLTPNPVIIVDPAAHLEITRVPASGREARVIETFDPGPVAEKTQNAIPPFRIPCTVRTIERIEGIPAEDEGPILVSWDVARSMTQLGLHYGNDVYTCGRPVRRSGQHLGYANLIIWPGLSKKRT